MCRFAMYVGPEIGLDTLLTRPRNSLIHQSYGDEERDEPLNGDGFGVAWYNPRRSSSPAVFRSVSPAWNNQNLLHIARLTESTSVFAHVRAATPGLPVSEQNCHPFVAGRLAFMHNGEVGGFPKLKRKLIDRLSDDAYDAIGGSTDSEHVFALFRDQLARGGRHDVQGMAAALEATVHELLAIQADHGVEGLWLNVAIGDGERAVALRYATTGRSESLYCHIGRRYIVDGDVCRMVDADEAGGAVIVSSEKLSDDFGWDPVPDNHLVLVDADRSTVIRPLC